MLRQLTVDDFFADGGFISRVKPNYRQRPGQSDCSEIVLDAIMQRCHLIGEAPTGFGKSFALLIPAIIEAVTQGKRIVLTTDSINLQDQIVNKDLPLLADALALAGHTLTYAVAKGRGNYICRDKLDEMEFGGSRLMEWAKTQDPMKGHTGDVASVPFEFDLSDWFDVASGDDCAKAACPYYKDGPRGHDTECFVCCAQQDFRSAQVVVTNHTLFLLDAQVGVGNLLGPYDIAIIDEAQSLPNKARDCWGMEFKPRTVSYSLRLIKRMLDRAHIDYIGNGDIEEIRVLEDQMFGPFAELVAQEKNIALKQIDPSIIEASRVAADDLVERLRVIHKELGDFITQSEDDPETVIIRQAKEKLAKMVSALEHIYGDRIDEEFADNWLTFMDTATTNRGARHAVLNLKPIEVAPLMKGLLLDQVPTCIFFSATMRVLGSFSFMKRQLGLGSSTLEFVGTSPFDLERQVRVYWPKHLADPRDSDYLTDLEAALIELINDVQGRSLILFTNSRHMQLIHARVSKMVPYHCYLQGTAAPDMLLQSFRNDVSSCLFGTRRFFVGVDVPGESLSCVALVRAPFSVPTDPLFSARCAKIEQAGDDPFLMLSKPEMLFDLGQAFGRLIRDEQDIGTFALLDSRAAKKGYARDIKALLPKSNFITKLGQAPEVEAPSRSRSVILALEDDD